jgi:hypothetical protein
MVDGFADKLVICRTTGDLRTLGRRLNGYL